MEQGQQPNKVLIGVVIAVVLAAVAAGAWYMANNSSDNASTQETQSTSSSDQLVADEDDEKVVVESFKAGDYQATGLYQSPGGNEEVAVQVALADDGTINAVEVEPKAASGTSRQYQSEFVNNYKDLVVGKNINEVELSRVAGSSLTSNGFNDALDQIKEDAKG